MKDSEESSSPNKRNLVGKCSDNDMDADVEDEVVPGTTHGANKRKRIVYPGRKRPGKAISGGFFFLNIVKFCYFSKLVMLLFTH